MSKYIEMCKECIHYQMCGSTNIDAPCAAYKNKTDMVEVIRCKDCIYSFMSITGETVLYCDMRPSDDHLGLDKNYYCADGERREDNE